MKLGKAFSDSLIIGQSSHSRISKDRETGWWMGKGRALLFATTLFVSIFILLWQLFRLTVIDGYRFRSLADGNRTRELVEHAPRGDIVDRAGVPLVKNEVTYRLLSPCSENPLAMCTSLLSEERGKQLEEGGLPIGAYMEVDYARSYPFGDSMAHVIGYIGELSQEELEDEYYALRRYLPGDRVGRMGAEAVYEEKLRGRDGRELVEVDAQGAVERSLGKDRATAGETVTLALDGPLSQTVADAFPDDKKGAVIVSKPSTGEILAIYSSPSFNPNQFTLGMTNEQYEALMTSPDLPMFFRAIGGVYPPGSTYKLITSVAALEEGAMKRETTVEDTGVIRIGPFSYPNWYFLQYGRTEGLVDMVKALQRSNDIYFYKAGEAVGIEKLAVWSRKMGVGSPLGIEVGGEASGNMPDPAWKRAQFATDFDLEARNHLWYLGDTYHVSIGQGYLLTTPIQVNTWTNVIANGGNLCRPTIAKREIGHFGSNEACKSLGLKKDTISTITEGMKQACETGGTGWPFFGFSIERPDESSTSGTIRTSIPVACKTGTAEFGDDPEEYEIHAWFTVFAPLPSSGAGSPASITGEPEISVTVLVEGAGQGSDVAAPVAKKILEAWFSR